MQLAPQQKTMLGLRQAGPRPKTKEQRLKEQKELIDAGETMEELLCRECNTVKPIEAFPMNQKTGKPLVRCEPCRNSRNAAVNDWYKTDAGKACAKRSSQSDKGKASHKRFAMSEKGRAVIKKYLSTNKAKEARARCQKKLVERRRTDASFRRDCNVLRASNRLMSGDLKTSPTFIARTSFESESEFLSVVKSKLDVASGMTMENHGTVWHLEHSIPRQAYDFDNPEDVRRCWSAENLEAMTPEKNAEKWVYLHDETLAKVGRDRFPVAWNGEFPTEAFKKEFYARVLAEKQLDAVEEAGPSEEAPESDLCDDSMEEESDA